jgi:GT2 family glycosyltransferase
MGGAQTHVVILNWNGRKYIRDCLTSIFNQTYDGARILVVDNGSTDGSADLVRDGFPEATLLALPENLHFARGTNAGIEEALRDKACELVVTLNNDTRSDPEFLRNLVDAARDPRVGMVSAKLLFMDRPRFLNTTGIRPARDGSGVDRGWNEPDEGQFDSLTDVFAPSAGAALYRRDVFDRVGLFDGDFVAYYEDLDLAWRARLAGWESRFAPSAVVYHKYSASSSYFSPWKTYQGERNRIWNLVENYPARHMAVGVPWNGARVLAALRKRIFPQRYLGPSSEGTPDTGPTFAALAAATVRARLDAYASLSSALYKRRLRNAYRRVDARTVGRWLRDYGVAIKDMPVN